MKPQLDILIKNGEVASDKGTSRLDIGISGEKIVALGPALSSDTGQVIDAAGRIVFPGLIDSHTHMGIPIMGTHSIDDFESGSVAAACGGVTTIVDFTVQDAGQTLAEAIDVRVARADGKAHVDYALHVNVTDQPLARIAEIPDLIGRGFSAFKVFSTYREAGMMITWPEFRQVLAAVDGHGGLLFLHAEDNDMIERQTRENVDAGHKGAIYHARSRTAEAEATAITAAAEIAAELDARLYIVHLSSEQGLEAALAARRKGTKLILETCPQYLVLSEEKYLGADGHRWITTPPLRTQNDAEALWQAIAGGEVEVVATDHCPFTLDQKEMGNGAFHLTPNGIPGVETLFPLLYTFGVSKGRISLARLVEVLACRPAELFGLHDRKGRIAVGCDADLLLWDPAPKWQIQPQLMHGKADWSPYAGMEIAGRAEGVFLRGKLLVRDGQFVGEYVRGQLLRNRSNLN